MASLAWPLLALVFLAGAIATWVAGTSLAKSTDALDNRFNLGDAIGGMVLLSIAGTLPEIAITVSAAMQGHLGLAAGNLIGGIAIQTMVLIICDVTAGVGAAVALAGAGILIFYPREERIVTVSPTVGPSGAGIAVSGGF